MLEVDDLAVGFVTRHGSLRAVDGVDLQLFQDTDGSHREAFAFEVPQTHFNENLRPTLRTRHSSVHHDGQAAGGFSGNA